MNLNLQMIWGELEDMQLSGVNNTPYSQFPLAYPLLYDGSTYPIDKSAVYITEADFMPPESWAMQPISIICLGMPPAIWRKSACNILYILDSITPVQLMNRLIRIFQKYSLLEQELNKALKNRFSPRQLTEIMLPLFNNSISCITFNYRCLFQILPPYDINNLTQWQKSYIERFRLNDNSYMTYEDILLGLSYEEPGDRNALRKGVQLFDDSEGTGLKMLSYNFTHGNKLLATLYIDEVFRPLRQGDYSLCHILTEYLKQCLLYSNVYVYGNSPELEKTLHMLLGKKKVSKQQLKQILSTLNWDPEGSYYCIVLRSLASSDIEGNISYAAIDITAHFPDNIYVIKDQTIVMVVNAATSKTDRKETISSLLPHLRDKLLMAAVSLEFYDFQQLGDYYDQALSAMTLGQKQHPTFWYFYYDDYILSRIIDGCRQYPAETMLPQGLKQLIRHDKRKGTSYTKLLKLYLQNERGIVSTISKAFIHRSTFIYQIKKISEICNMNLDDPQVRLTLLMVFEILEQTKQDDQTTE